MSYGQFLIWGFRSEVVSELLVHQSDYHIFFDFKKSHFLFNKPIIKLVFIVKTT